MGTVGFNVKFKSEVNIVRSKVADALNDAAEELENEAVEWVQYQMLYGYKDAHGKDRHTEIYDPEHDFALGPHMIDDIHANTQRNSQDSYSVQVGSNKDYAVYVHNGTRKLKGRPFLRDALMNNISNIEKIMKKHTKDI